MIIPIDQIEQDTLFSIIQAFVLREGTDYGVDEKSLDEKVEDVYQQLKTGDAVLQYSQEHESVNIVPKGHLQYDANDD